MQLDNLAAIRELFEALVENCKKTYIPSDCLTIDEMLVAFRGRCKFRQYIPSKPAKYGIKIIALVDANNYYIKNLEIYPGKQPEGPFSISNKPFDVVDRIVQPITRTNQNVTFDNWFTSYELVQNLLTEHKLTSVGTLRKNKRQVPVEFTKTRGVQVFSSRFGFQKDVTLVAHMPKKNKIVLLMSSLHHNDEINTYYNRTKCGVDVVDELCATYDVSRNSKRWPLKIFYASLNIAAINGLIINKINNCSKTKRRRFIKNLSLDLVMEHLKLRQNISVLPRELRQKIGKLVEVCITNYHRYERLEVDTPRILCTVPRFLGEHQGNQLRLGAASPPHSGATPGRANWYRARDAVSSTQSAQPTSSALINLFLIIKSTSLEFCSILLGAQLSSSATQVLRCKINRHVYWSDSKVTLEWIKSACKAKTFVANRVAAMTEQSDPENWQHVSTAENPADLCSRGLDLQNISKSDIWWHGPAFLGQDESSWPSADVQAVELPELKALPALVAESTPSVSFIDVTRKQRSRIQENVTLEKPYSEPPAISDHKKRDLMSLCTANLIPQSYHNFFESLPCSSKQEYECDTDSETA
ncbi:unnamed protein product [Euphydryas editha]|uniref:PiggyBac transposable element-derived protein domain-containing protein n=1 Tax=Euphydryas editha TaxID=104508 RepID=A0AAU9UT60_EUPED|nr:unnamed protein product [Euphydryas editha]